jgi:predicted phosphodiesterase
VRIAVVSDIHGNLTAFEAVLADLKRTSPDLILHGGDLAQGGARPAEIVDRVRDLGWQGVLGNVDEALFSSESMEEFASHSSAPPSLWVAVREMTAATQAALGEERIAWLRALPRIRVQHPIALVHASPETTWRSPGPDASDDELKSVYGRLGQPIAVYGHIHRSYIRRLPEMIVSNTGSVSLSYDGDRRAAYLLLDDSKPAIRRLEYDVDREIQHLATSNYPHADWISRTLSSAAPQMP